MVERMSERINRFLDRIESRIALWGVLGGSSVVGLITGLLSRGVDLINQFGLFGWWVAGLCGALLAALFFLALMWGRYAWVSVRTRQRWEERVSDFNPLEKDFQNKRMRVYDLMHPLSKKITGKRLYDCELIGPANIFLLRDISLFKTDFVDCVVVVLWPEDDGQIRPGNSVVVENTEMHGGAIWGCTLLITPQLVPTFKEMGAKFTTLTGDSDIDSQWRQGSEKETPR